jgi:hypothetical protein
MADTKISGLTAVTSLATGDKFPFARGATTRRIDADYLPGYLFASAEITSPVTVSATVEATPDDVVSSGAFTYLSTPVRIEFYAPRVDVGGTAGSWTILNLWDDTTELTRIAAVTHTAGTQVVEVPVYAVRYLTPTAASHTYKIRAWRINSNGSVQAGGGAAGQFAPAGIRVTKA